MNALPHTTELEEIVRQTVWFLESVQALGQPFCFVAHVLNLRVVQG
jgi:hypothetical protein